MPQSLLDVLTVREAAEILHCSRRTVQRLARDGLLTGREVGSSRGMWLLDAESVLAMARQNRKSPRAYRRHRGQDTTATREATASCLQ